MLPSAHWTRSALRAIAAAILALHCLQTQPPQSFPFGLPLDLSIPIAPTPFTGNDGKSYLVYEVHVSNFSPREFVLDKFEVLHETMVLAEFEGAVLNSLIALPGSPGEADRRTLPAGRRAVVFLWIPFTPPAPLLLSHRVTAAAVTLEGGTVRPVATPPVAIGPPLSGSDWMAVNGPSQNSGHRRALIAIEGSARIAQRFGIDWVRMGQDMRTFTGDQKDNKSYRAYGAEIFAVGEGTVAATKDGIPENIPGPASRAVPITNETVGGNYIVIDLGGGRFAFYAHIQPGTLRVKTGDRVKRGQVIGLVGNSGNSTEPHLHFHVSNGVSPLSSEGLPYTIAGMKGMPLQNERVNFGR